MNTYLEMQQRVIAQARKNVRSDTRDAAIRIREAAETIVNRLDGDDVKGARTIFSTLTQLLPQYLAPIDDHLKEAEIVGRFAANMADEEVAR